MADNDEPADIFEIVRGATVTITGLNNKGVRTDLGSGFFAAPGIVLSCAHVVAPAQEPRVKWKGQELGTTVVRCEPATAGPDARFDSPDVALLRVDVDTPCVPLSLIGPQIGDRAWVDGITEIRTNRPETYAALLTIADLDHEIGLFRLTGDQVAQGLSGGPVLDTTTFEVCGIFKSELDTIGWAVPLDAALAVLDEKIYEANLAARPNGLPALRVRQEAIERHARWVANSLKGRSDAQGQLRDEFRDRRLHPDLVSDEAFPEWAARQLFELSVPELHSVLRTLAHMLPKEVLISVFELVACCRRGRDGSDTWISSSASDALLHEIAADEPRALRVTAGQNESAEAVLRRAFFMGFDKRWVCGPVSADPQDDTARDLVAAYLAFAGYLDPAEWHVWDDPTKRKKLREELVSTRSFALVGLASALDDAWFSDLAEQFKGFPLMFRGPQFAAPNRDDMILDLQPPIDQGHERTVSNFRARLAGSAN